METIGNSYLNGFRFAKAYRANHGMVALMRAVRGAMPTTLAEKAKLAGMIDATLGMVQS
jgi:hypothetical protein